MIWAFASAVALAGTGRLAVGFDGASGWAPAEPSWSRFAESSATFCGGVTVDWITGGHDYAGSRGQVYRTPDGERWGGTAQLCSTTAHARTASLGALYGRQWGGALYVAATAGAGLATFQKLGPPGGAIQQTYLSVGPYFEPALALGLAAPPGVSVEVGPYARIAPPVLAAYQVRPSGQYVGQVGLSVTILAGAASPVVPWRRWP